MPADLKAGWLEKRSGDSSSLNALPVDSWKWQRRWWAAGLAEPVWQLGVAWRAGGGGLAAQLRGAS